MFNFQKLLVYQNAKGYNKEITELIGKPKFDRVTNDQPSRAYFSNMSNIVEGSSRFSSKDRRCFLEIAQGRAIRCVGTKLILSNLYL